MNPPGAGYFGKGFAVVADEIGKLATKTSENSKIIGSKIDKIIDDINEGMTIAGATSESTEKIFLSVEDIKFRLENVSNSMTSQSGIVEQVSHQSDSVKDKAVIIAMT